MSSEALLAIVDLTVAARRGRQTRILDSVSLRVDEGEIVGLVGESGSGKTMTVRATMGLLPSALHVISGSVLFSGRELLSLHESELRDMRGRDISMIFQSPRDSMSPLMRVGEQVAEPLVIHRGVSRKHARQAASNLLTRVRIPDSRERVASYPHEMSGGMLQRASLASALSCQPRLIIADEPTTALDVTIQAQILNLLLEVRADTGAAILMISHDLGVVAQTCDRVAVMYSGRIVEEGTVDSVFAAPSHPYTAALLKSTPRLDEAAELVPISGQPPDLTNPPSGCRFRPRCSVAFARCAAEPPLIELDDSRRSRCWLC